VNFGRDFGMALSIVTRDEGDARQISNARRSGGVKPAKRWPLPRPP
jgi:hypothetical protein